MRDLSQDIASLHIERGQSAPNPWRKRAIVAVVVLAVVTAIFLAVWLLFPRPLKPAVVIGEIITVSPAQAEVKLMASGYVVPLRHSVIASKQPGRLESMLVK
jgi:multidrug efflux pump subunit AcrA (membrane-fusion protein)